MLTSPDTIPGVIDSFIQARHVWARDQRQDIWGLHTPEGPETPTYAEALGNYFATTDRIASTHFGCDNNSGVRYARDDQTCAAARGANRDGLHIEIAGRAGQTDAEWRDDFSIDAVHRAARIFVEVGWKVHGIPPVLLTVADLRRRKAGDRNVRGIATHADLVTVYGGDYRSDPGDNFPHDEHFRFIHELIGDNVTPPMSEWNLVFNDAPIGGDPDGIVQWFEQGLQQLGYRGFAVDGRKWKSTENAVMQFKRDHLDNDDPSPKMGGKAYKRFLELLNTPTPAPPPTADVEALKQQLERQSADLVAAQTHAATLQTRIDNAMAELAP